MLVAIVILLALILAVLLVGSAAVKNVLGSIVAVIGGLLLLAIAGPILAEHWLTIMSVIGLVIAVGGFLFYVQVKMGLREDELRDFEAEAREAREAREAAEQRADPAGYQAHLRLHEIETLHRQLEAIKGTGEIGSKELEIEARIRELEGA